MKKLLFIALAAASLTFAGCSTAQKFLLTPTASVVIPATTNADGVVTAAQTNDTEFAPAPGVLNTIATGQKIAPLLPPPFDWAGEAALSLLAAGLGIYAKSKSGKLKTAQAITAAVVSGVEAVNHTETKVAIKKSASRAGVQPLLDTIVQTVTAPA